MSTTNHWSILSNIFPDGAISGDGSGYAVSMNSDGTRVAVGAPFAGGGAGVVKVFDLVNGVWTQVGADFAVGSAGDNSGFSVSISGLGTFVAVGSPHANGGGANSGLVRVYEYDGVNTWDLVGGAMAHEGIEITDLNGYSVSISDDGTRVAVGAPGVASDAGQVQVFEYNGVSWALLSNMADTGVAGDRYGTSVSISGDGTRVAVGAPGAGTYKGQARVYHDTGDPWALLGAPFADTATTNEQNGFSVSMTSDGTHVAVGAPGAGDATGQVQVYRYTGSAWEQVGASFANTGALGEQNGFAVSIADDGARVAVGAPNYGQPGTGQVRVFKYSGNSWTQVGTTFTNSGTLNDSVGYAVSISSDGKRVAVGEAALSNATPGQAYVIDFITAQYPSDDIIGGGDHVWILILAVLLFLLLTLVFMA